MSIISGFMKNSKCFPVESWLRNSFLTVEQLATCSTLLPGDGSDMALTAIDLEVLGATLNREGPQPAVEISYLDSVEQSRLEALTFAKRQREWLGGRIAAKKAALTLLKEIPDPHMYLSLRVENNPAGRPYLCSEGLGLDGTPLVEKMPLHAVLPEISISHSSGIAAALAVTRYPCGLDVQKISAKAISVKDRFTTPAEQTLLTTVSILHDTTEADKFTLLWAAKESLRKAIACHPLLGFSEVILCQLEGSLQNGMIARCSSPRIRSGDLPPVFLALSEGFACAITINLHISASIVQGPFRL